jgi:O-acetyl-ADP-ribose deacetylase (regulator of RNase III)
MVAIEICVYSPGDGGALYNIVKSYFLGLKGFTVNNGSIVNASYDTIIAAGNSFAEMNGGVDGIINTHLSTYTPEEYVQSRVKRVIEQEFIGELPVGTSVLISTSHPFHRRLIYAPTMRVAENVSTSLNAYLAFRGALVTMMRNGITKASTSLFCTGAGGMDVHRACAQMREAYLTVVNKSLIGGDWRLFHQHHRKLLANIDP